MATPITSGSMSRATVQIAETIGDVTGMTFTNDGTTMLWYHNAGAIDRTLTITTVKTVGRDSLAVADPVITVLASADWTPLGFFDVDTYGTTVTVTPSHSQVRLKVWTIG